jgi:hypothetical protein
MKRITDPDFRYVPAARTDLRKTFARIRREQRATDAAEAVAKVVPITVRPEPVEGRKTQGRTKC